MEKVDSNSDWELVRKQILIKIAESTTTCGKTKRETSVTFKVTEVKP